MVLIRGTRQMFAHDNVFERHGTTRPAGPAHLSADLRRIVEMMERKPADHVIERHIRERKPDGVTQLKPEVGAPGLPAIPFRDPEHLGGQVDPDHLATNRRETERNITGPTGNVQDDCLTIGIHGLHQSPYLMLIMEDRIGGERTCLAEEFPPDDLLVR
jgi:hypothetical protein